MERLTGSNYSSLVEAYSAVYNDDLREKINEENQIHEFLNVIDALVEEGYDLSEYTYDELYESYINEGWGLLRLASPLIQGAKVPVKNLLTKAGQALVPTLVGLGLDQYLTGGKVRDYTGRAIQGVRQVGHSIPNPDELKHMLQAPPRVAKPSSQSRTPNNDPWSSAPSSLLNQSTDLFDIIKGHLLDEGYADTEEAAIAIMSSMSEEWRQSITENILAGAIKLGANIVRDPQGAAGAAGNTVGTIQRGIDQIPGKLQKLGTAFNTARERARTGGTPSGTPRSREFAIPPR